MYVELSQISFKTKMRKYDAIIVMHTYLLKEQFLEFNTNRSFTSTLAKINEFNSILFFRKVKKLIHKKTNCLSNYCKIFKTAKKYSNLQTLEINLYITTTWNPKNLSKNMRPDLNNGITYKKVTYEHKASF